MPQTQLRSNVPQTHFQRQYIVNSRINSLNKLRRFLEKEAILFGTVRHPSAYIDLTSRASPPIPRPCFRRPIVFIIQQQKQDEGTPRVPSYWGPGVGLHYYVKAHPASPCPPQATTTTTPTTQTTPNNPNNPKLVSCWFYA